MRVRIPVRRNEQSRATRAHVSHYIFLFAGLPDMFFSRGVFSPFFSSRTFNAGPIRVLDEKQWNEDGRKKILNFLTGLWYCFGRYVCVLLHDLCPRQPSPQFRESRIWEQICVFGARRKFCSWEMRGNAWYRVPHEELSIENLVSLSNYKSAIS